MHNSIIIGVGRPFEDEDEEEDEVGVGVGEESFVSLVTFRFGPV